MTDDELTRLITIVWAIATAALFTLLARWSTGGSWGITSGIVAGVRGLSRRDQAGDRLQAGSAELPPLALDTTPAGARGARPMSEETALGTELVSEVEELPSRRV